MVVAVALIEGHIAVAVARSPKEVGVIARRHVAAQVVLGTAQVEDEGNRQEWWGRKITLVKSLSGFQ